MSVFLTRSDTAMRHDHSIRQGIQEMLTEARRNPRYLFPLSMDIAYEAFPLVRFGGCDIHAWSRSPKRAYMVLLGAARRKRGSRRYVTCGEVKDPGRQNLANIRNDLRTCFPDWPRETAGFIFRNLPGLRYSWTLAVEASSINIDDNVSHWVPDGVDQAVSSYQEAREGVLAKKEEGKLVQDFNQALRERIPSEILKIFNKAEWELSLVTEALKLLGLSWQPQNGEKEDFDALATLLF